MQPTIAVVGAGVSGSLIAIQLMRCSTEQLDIHLIERSGSFGRGIAYGTDEHTSLLNVPAAKMSAFPDDSKHFLRWLHANDFRDSQGRTADEGSFVPRTIYGRYITETLNMVEMESYPCINLIRHHDTVLDLKTYSDSAVLYLQSDEAIYADKVVLAFGNFPPRDLPCMDEHVRSHPRYIANPWANRAFDQIPADEPVLIIGTGLTMVDTVLALYVRGHHAQMVAVSKHGLLPQTHRLSPHSVPPLNVDELPTTARSLLRHVRQHVETVIQSTCVDWRVVLDSLRPITAAIWERLPIEEKRRLLRHAQPYWEVHRHRLPPESVSVIEHLRDTNQLVVQEGHIKHFKANENDIDAEIESAYGRHFKLTAKWVINCTGANSDYTTLTEPLIVNLLRHGLVRPDCLHLGLDAVHNGALRDASGDVSTLLYTISSPLKGILWETTAVPEIRTQAAGLTQIIMANLISEGERLR